MTNSTRRKGRSRSVGQLNCLDGKKANETVKTIYITKNLKTLKDDIERLESLLVFKRPVSLRERKKVS